MSRTPFVFVVALFTVLASGFPAVAQEDARALIERMERLERDLQALNIKVFRGEDPPQELRDAATQATGGDFTGPVAARLSARLSEIESQMGLLEGRLEEMDFANRQLTSRIDKLVSDVDFRLSTLEQGRPAGQPMAQGQQPGAIAQGTAPGTTLPQISAAPGPASVTAQGDSFGQTLGTIPQSDLDNAQAPQDQAGTAAANQAPTQTPATTTEQTPADGQTAAVPAGSTATPVAGQPAPAITLPEGTPQDQYAYARRFLVQNDFASAEQALSAFLEVHPDHQLSGNARYWLAETYYVQQSYVQAAQAFMAGYQKNPKGNKAPDSLLKLGMSLSAIDKPQEACASFDKLRQDFPDLPRHLRPVLERERDKNNCP